MIKKITLNENGNKLDILDNGETLNFSVLCNFTIDREEFLNALGEKPKTMQQIIEDRNKRWRVVDLEEGE